jgi:hypothetical protein
MVQLGEGVMHTITPEQMRENMQRYKEQLRTQREIEDARHALYLQRARLADANVQAIKKQAESLPDGTGMLGCGHPATIASGKIRFAQSCFCDPIAIVETPDLSGRIAKCWGCRHRPIAIAPSALNLPFFRYNANSSHDEYSCLCWGVE